MSLPTFDASEDPGSSFAHLVRQSRGPDPLLQQASGELDVPHGTTCVAIKFDGGVLVAGDRRATSGNLISHRAIEKVFATDKWSAIAIAGAAGPAIEMVRLFQLQLEHYEKVEGKSLTLNGKANQLSQMIKQHLPAAMRGMAVVPLFAGFDRKRDVGRLFQFDITGGRYEEREFGVTGSGSLHAGSAVKLGYRPGMDRDEVVALALSSLYHAADEDSATGLPDFIRKIFPIVATISADGFERVEDDELEAKYDVIIEGIKERGTPA